MIAPTRPVPCIYKTAAVKRERNPWMLQVLHLVFQTVLVSLYVYDSTHGNWLEIWKTLYTALYSEHD